MGNINIDLAKCLSFVTNLSNCASMEEMHKEFQNFCRAAKLDGVKGETASPYLKENEYYDTVVDYSFDFECILSCILKQGDLGDLFKVIKKTRMDLWTILDNNIYDDDLEFESVEKLVEIRFDNNPSAFALWLLKTYFVYELAYHLERIR